MARSEVSQQDDTAFVIEDRRQQPRQPGSLSERELHEVYSRIRDRLRGALPPRVFSQYIDPLEPAQLTESGLRIYAPREITVWVRDRFSREIGKAARETVGREVPVEVLVAPAAPRPARSRKVSSARPRARVRWSYDA